MCIVTDSVNDVSNTKIATFHIAYSFDNGITIKPSQLIVYSANVDSIGKSNAFVLPVFNPGNDISNIIPLDFNNLTDFFIKIDNIYEKLLPRRLMTNSFGSNILFNSAPLLQVHQVGNYKFSIMASKIDFDRLDRSKLNIDPIAKSSIDVHSNNYSFIVYQFFDSGKLDIPPFAYICPSLNNQMIVPTIHGHPHIDKHYVDFQDTADYDHKIYVLFKDPSKPRDKSILKNFDDILKNINKDYLNRKIRIFSPKSFNIKINTIIGNNTNRNLMVDQNGSQFMNDLIVNSTKY